MTKPLAGLMVLITVAVLSLVGWFLFERASVLSRLDYTQKSTEPLNPVLRLEVLQPNE